MPDNINLAIFASGAGSNAKKIIEHFNHHQNVIVKMVACNKPGAGVLEVARQNGIEILIVEKEIFKSGDAYVPHLQNANIHFVVLAGFLWKIPEKMISEYPGKIINIHPALLPKYGGKGMFGEKVHQSVITAGDTVSGITIHYVDGEYDHGKVIFQATCEVVKEETAQTLADKIHALEHRYYPLIIEELLNEIPVTLASKESL